jgi:hypothetical protein
MNRLAPLALVAFFLCVSCTYAQRKVPKPWYRARSAELRTAFGKDTDAYECAPGYKMYGKDCYISCLENQYMSPTRQGGQCLSCPRGSTSPAGSAGIQACRKNSTIPPLSVRRADSGAATVISSSTSDEVAVSAGKCHAFAMASMRMSVIVAVVPACWFMLAQ